MIEMLRRAASDRSLSIGEAWHLLDAAADEIERLQADAHPLAAERLCRAVEVAVLLEVCGDVTTGAVCHDPWCECKTHDQWQDAKSIWRAARQGNNRAPVAREGDK